jgi:hypothetical protein
MQSGAQPARASNKALWAGRILSGLMIAFLLLDSVMKLMRVAQAVQGTAQLGYPEQVVRTLGVVLLISVVLYAIPRTAVLGAILITGYLGGAVATQVRVGNPLFSYTLFPVYVGLLVWGGLFLRDSRLRALIPFRD